MSVSVVLRDFAEDVGWRARKKPEGASTFLPPGAGLAAASLEAAEKVSVCDSRSFLSQSASTRARTGTVPARAIAHHRRPARQHATRRASRVRAGPQLQEGKSRSSGRAANVDLKAEIRGTPIRIITGRRSMPADIATDVSIPTVGMLDQSLHLRSRVGRTKRARNSPPQRGRQGSASGLPHPA